MNGTPTMTAEEEQAWEQLAKSGRLRRYLKAEEDARVRGGRCSNQPRYERELARRANSLQEVVSK